MEEVFDGSMKCQSVKDDSAAQVQCFVKSVLRVAVPLLLIASAATCRDLDATGIVMSAAALSRSFDCKTASQGCDYVMCSLSSLPAALLEHVS